MTNIVKKSSQTQSISLYLNIYVYSLYLNNLSLQNFPFWGSKVRAINKQSLNLPEGKQKPSVKTW